MEQRLEWCEKREKPLVVVMYVATLILGVGGYCLAANGGKFFDWLMTQFAYLTPVMDWLCGC